MSGYGRGGRGAALLQALNSPVRRPGETSPPNGANKEENQPGSVAAPAPVSAAPRGRGALLLMAQQQAAAAAGTQSATPSSFMPSSSPAPGSSTGAARPVRPAGRGALLQTTGFKAAESQPTVNIASQHSAVQSSLHIAAPPTQNPGIPTQARGPDDTGQARGTHPPAQAPSRDRAIEQQGTSRLENMFNRMSVDVPELPKGHTGNPIPLAANYIPVRCKNEGVFQYAVSFDPQIDALGERKKLLYQHSETLGDALIFDGAILGLPIRLPNKETILESIRAREQTSVRIKVKFVKIVPKEASLSLYASKLRGVMHLLKMVQVGRNYYLPDKSVSVPQHRLDIWPGFVTSLHYYEGGLMLLCDVSHRVLRTETALSVMEDTQRLSSQHGIRDIHAEFRKKLLGETVLTRYNNKTYRIDDIAFDMSPETEFQTRNGNITFLDYYWKNYSKKISDRRQPLLIHRPTKKDLIRAGRRIPQGEPEMICLVPELCYMTGLTDEMRSDFRVMKDLQKHTRVDPSNRVREMTTFVDAIMSHPEASKELEKWGMALDLGHIKIQGRKFNPEMVIFGNGNATSAGHEADWGRSLDRERVITPVDLKCWLVFFTNRDRGVMNTWLDKTKFVSRNMGINVAHPVLVELQNDRSETYLRAIREKLNPEVQLVVTIFPTSRDDRYNAVKKLCCTEMPVPSQVIIGRTIKDERKIKSVAVKILLQINVKLGGELWAVKIPVRGLMVCGIDTYHEGKGGSGKSVGGFVASQNANCTKWFSRCCFQAQGQELIDGLLPVFIESIKQYHKHNHELPAAIMIYRDGVGDGAMKTVADHEIRQLQNAFSKWGDTYQPKFGFVVVQKRINTRLFLQKGPREMTNPGPGSIVDHTVVRRDIQDFFLVSQHVRQGTVSPTHYVVLEDSGQWKIDHVQQLSYKLTHLYYNWPGTVRVPAPCQYAHKLAQQVGQNLRKEPDPRLCDRLFYI